MNLKKHGLVSGTSLLLAFAVLPNVARSSERDGSAGCATIRVSTPDAPSATRARSRKTRTSFSASEILDLQFTVELSSNLPGAHRTELKLYTPKGHLYQTLLVTPSSEASKEAASDEGKRHRRRTEHGRRKGTAVLPVAGTTIVTSSLYGDWKVEAHVDGQPTACSRSVEFSIEP